MIWFFFSYVVLVVAVAFVVVMVNKYERTFCICIMYILCPVLPCAQQHSLATRFEVYGARLKCMTRSKTTTIENKHTKTNLKYKKNENTKKKDKVYSVENERERRRENIETMKPIWLICIKITIDITPLNIRMYYGSSNNNQKFPICVVCSLFFLLSLFFFSLFFQIYIRFVCVRELCYCRRKLILENVCRQNFNVKSNHTHTNTHYCFADKKEQESRGGGNELRTHIEWAHVCKCFACVQLNGLVVGMYVCPTVLGMN